MLHVVEPVTAYISAAMIPHYVPHVAAIEEDCMKEPKNSCGALARNSAKQAFEPANCWSTEGRRLQLSTMRRSGKPT